MEGEADGQLRAVRPAPVHDSVRFEAGDERRLYAKEPDRADRAGTCVHQRAVHRGEHQRAGAGVPVWDQ